MIDRIPNESRPFVRSLILSALFILSTSLNISSWATVGFPTQLRSFLQLRFRYGVSANKAQHEPDKVPKQFADKGVFDLARPHTAFIAVSYSGIA